MRHARRANEEKARQGGHEFTPHAHRAKGALGHSLARVHVGAQRIAIEGEGGPPSAKMAGEYERLVQRVASKVRGNMAGEGDEDSFLSAFSRETRKLGITYSAGEFGLMHEALSSNKWDCSSLSFLLFDVAGELGVPAKIAVVSSNGVPHVVARTKNFFFEAHGRDYEPIGKFAGRYGKPQLLASSPLRISGIAYFSRAYAKTEKGDFLGAERDFETAARLTGGFSFLYNNLGLARYAVGRGMERGGSPELAKQQYLGALAAIDKAIGLDGGRAEPYRNRGMVLWSLRMHEEAIASYGKAVELAPEFAIAHYDLAVAYYRNGNYKHALESFSMVIGLNPEDYDAYLGRGSVRYMLRDYEGAVADYREALRLNQGLAEAYYSLASALEKLGRAEEAEKAKAEYANRKGSVGKE